MAEQENSRTYVVTLSAVQRAIAALETVSVHEHFAGYLSIRRGLKGGSPSTGSSAIWDFHRRYLEAVTEGGSTVFVSPFASRGPSKLHIVNQNVAGSYGASSVRDGKPLAKVLSVSGKGTQATYALKPNHAVLASEELLKGNKIPAAALAIFLYRDYGMRLESPEISRVIAIFRSEFDFPEDDPAAKADFAKLFDNDAASFGPHDFELISENDHG